MTDFKDVMTARGNATQNLENLQTFLGACPNDTAVAIGVSAIAICSYMRSLECTLDYLVSEVLNDHSH